MSEEDTTVMALLEFLNACENGIAAAKRLISEAKGLKAKTGSKMEIEGITNAFPEDLRRLLIFEEDDENFVIRPRQYLGSENFSKVAAIVEGRLHGNYVSAGRDSHFRIKK